MFLPTLYKIYSNFCRLLAKVFIQNLNKINDLCHFILYKIYNYINNNIYIIYDIEPTNKKHRKN